MFTKNIYKILMGCQIAALIVIYYSFMNSIQDSHCYTFYGYRLTNCSVTPPASKILDSNKQEGRLDTIIPISFLGYITTSAENYQKHLKNPETSLKGSNNETTNSADINNSLPPEINESSERNFIDRIGWIAQGRLGNKLFQYAAIYALAKKTGKIPILIVKPNGEESHPLSQYFKITKYELPDLWYNFTSNVTGMNSVSKDFQLPTNKFYDIKVAYDNSLPSRVINESYNIFNGHPNSYKYFAEFQEDILKEFRFKDNIQQYADNFFHDLLFPTVSNRSITMPNSTPESEDSSNISFIGIQVRRTDMLTWTHENNAKFGGSKYIKRAMNWFKNYFAADQLSNGQGSHKYIFVVCSDDLDWCRLELNSSLEFDIRYCPGVSPIQDLSILASCNYSIMTQGTYGWWGGYLARSNITIYPTNYYYENSTQITQKNFTYHTKYFPNWIGLSVD